jgi:hypothetical protein
MMVAFREFIDRKSTPTNRTSKTATQFHMNLDITSIARKGDATSLHAKFEQDQEERRIHQDETAEQVTALADNDTRHRSYLLCGSVQLAALTKEDLRYMEEVDLPLAHHNNVSIFSFGCHCRLRISVCKRGWIE